MKNIFLIFCFCLLFVNSSCTKDESLDPRPVIVDADFVRLDITKKRLDFNQLATTSFGGLLTTPNSIIEKYELYIRRKKTNGVLVGNYIKLLTVSSFPFELNVTPQLIADAYSIPMTALETGESYGFIAYATNKQGKVINYNDLSSVVRTQTGMKQGFKFYTDLQTNPTSLDFDNYQNQ